MLFARFLTKKPQTATENPAVASGNQAALAEQARQSADPALRGAAANQLQNLALLRQLLDTDADSGVRAAAALRYRDLLCASADDGSGISLSAKLDELAQRDDPPLVEHLARHASAPEIRRAALERVHSPTLLAECAVRDSLATHRSLAVERLHDRQALEQVVRQIGKRDHHVYRIARDQLRQLAAQEELPQRVGVQRQELCAKAERLGRQSNWQSNWNQDRALLAHLDRQWAALDAEYPPDADLLARYQAERERFLSAHAADDLIQATRIAQHEALDVAQAQRQSLLDELAGASALTDDAALTALRERIATAWNALPDSVPRQLDARYAALMQAVDAAQQIVTERRQSAERLQRLVARARRLQDDSRTLDPRRVRTLLEQGRALAAAQPETASAQEFQTLAARLDVRLDHHRRHAEQRLAQLPERLAELETHLAAGEIKKADPLYQSLHAGLELIQASELPADATVAIANRLRALAPQLRELQHWRRWGADQHREGLCADMEALRLVELPLETLAEQLHALQMDWKGLDQSGSPANQSLWERFHAASESVYARCRPHLERQAAERDANRLARERVCQQLEAFLSQVDWERVDWKKILRAERETRQTWAAIGPTEGRQRKALERRFRQSLKQLDRRLDAERKASQAHKHQLIEQVRALAEAPDLEAAIERAKALQREWRTTVPLRQKDENKLWQSFRAACDAVFERRAALHQNHANALQEQLAIRETICAEALAFAASEQDPRRLATGQREFEERWRASQSLPIPRQIGAQLAQRWQHCRETLERQRQESEERQRQLRLELIRRQSELCERLELTLLGQPTETLDPAAARELWDRCPAAPDSDLQQALATRFAFALTAAEDPRQLAALQQRYQANATQRSQLCLQLEIVAGVPSPAELAQERLAFQVARLTERMAGSEEDPLQDAARLLRDWYLCGPAPHSDSLNARFERVRQALAHPATTAPPPAAS